MVKKGKPIRKKAIQGKSPSEMLILSLILGFFSFLIYSNTLGHQYALDDASVITDNFLVKRGVDGISDLLSTSYRYGYWNEPGTLYRPFSLMMFAVEYDWFNGQAWIGHLMNVLMYALTIVLLFRVLRFIFPNAGLFIPFLISLFFAAHPIHTEVVANIKSRDEIGAFLFVLLSIYSFFSFLNSNRPKWLIFALFSFFIAFMFKENVITFLAVFPLILYFQGGIQISRILFLSALFLIPTSIYLGLRYLVLDDLNTINSLSIIENVLAGADSKSIYYATVFALMARYLWMTFVPWPLSSDYSYPEIGLYSFSDPIVIASVAIHLLLIAYVIFGLMKKHPEAFGLAFYLITFSIVSNLLITIGASFGERFLYVPVLGILIALFFLLSRILGKIEEIVTIKSSVLFLKSNRLLSIILLFMLLTASGLTMSRNKAWKDDFTLYGTDVITCDKSSRLHYFYGLELLQDKHRNASDPEIKEMYLDSALKEFTRSADLYPDYAGVYERMAYAMVLKKDQQKALELYNKSLTLDPNNSITINNLGQVYFNLKDYKKAEELYRKALQYNPKFADAYFNLGSTLGTIGDFAGSVQSFKKAIEFDPENATAYYYTALSLSSMNRIQEAQSYFNKAAQLDSRYKK